MGDPFALLTVAAVFAMAFAVIVGGVVSLVRVFSGRSAQTEASPAGAASGERREIERLTRALAEAETARTEAEMANRAKSDFLAVVSHELRTPLSSILGFAEIIQNQMFGPAGSDRYVDYAKDIHDGGEHLLGIVNGILDLSKVESGAMELNEETIDLLALMNDATSLILGRAEAQGITLKMTLPQSLPPLLADGRLVKQMLINLLSNAVDFTPSGGWVLTTAERDGRGGLTLAVADTGVGISADDLPRAIMPFNTFGDSSGRTSRGIGLGLPLVKSLIELHGGDFQINSKEGAGTTVALTFPPDRVGAGIGAGVGEEARSNGTG